jgi:hypothetical protein
VGPPARAFCGERANHRAYNSTPPCDNLIALGMRVFIPSSKCHNRLIQSRSVYASSRHPVPSIAAREARFQHGPRYLIPRPLSLLRHQSYHSAPSHKDDPTIYALSTASGKAAIAVIRVSGSACRQVLSSTCICYSSLKRDRYMKAFALRLPFRSLDMQHFASYTVPVDRRRLLRSWILVRSSCTSLHRIPSLVKMCSNCTSMAGPPLCEQY